MNDQRSRQRTVIDHRVRQFRNKLWPDAETRIWKHEKWDGWLIVPRAMPLIMRILDNLTKGKPVSATYFDLFCRTFRNGFVNAKAAKEMSFYSGFDGERAIRTWESRINKLSELGFISVKEGPSGPISYILIEDPFLVIKKLHEAGKISDRLWQSLQERMSETGSAEIYEFPEEPVIATEKRKELQNEEPKSEESPPS